MLVDLDGVVPAEDGRELGLVHQILLVRGGGGGRGGGCGVVGRGSGRNRVVGDGEGVDDPAEVAELGGDGVAAGGERVHLGPGPLDGGLGLGTHGVGAQAGLLGGLHDLGPGGRVVLVGLAVHPLDVLGRALPHDAGALLGLGLAALGPLAGLGLADPGVLEEALGLALGGVTGAGGIRLGLGEHRLGEVAHPGRLRLRLGEPVAALGRGAAEQGLHAVPVGAGALGELLVVRAGPGVGVGLGLGEDLADRALRPRQVGLGGGHDLVGLGLGVGEQRGGVGAGLLEQLVGGGARPGVAGLDLGEQGRDLGLGLAAVPGGVLAASRARSRSRSDDGGVAQLGELGGVGGVLQAPPLLVRALLLRRAASSCPRARRGRRSSSCVGTGLGLGQAGLRLLLGQRDGLVAGLGGAGPQQRGLVGRVGEHDLDLGAGLLEAALGLLARREHGGLQLLQLVGRLLRLATDPGRLGPGLGHLTVGVGPQLVGEVLGAGEQGQRFVDGAHGRSSGPRLPSSPRASTRQTRGP